MHENECLPSITLFFVTMAGVKYTIQEHVFLLRHYYELNRDIKSLCEEFEQEYPNRGFPTHHTIYNLDRKFKRTGSVGNSLRSGHLRDADTEENLYPVAQAVIEEPTRSTRRCALQLGLLRLVLHNKNFVMQKVIPFFFTCKFG